MIMSFIKKRMETKTRNLLNAKVYNAFILDEEITQMVKFSFFSLAFSSQSHFIISDSNRHYIEPQKNRFPLICIFAISTNDSIRFSLYVDCDSKN